MNKRWMNRTILGVAAVVAVSTGTALGASQSVSAIVTRAVFSLNGSVTTADALSVKGQTYLRADAVVKALGSDGFVASWHHQRLDVEGTPWMTADAKSKTVNLELVAAYNQVNNGFNFNGEANGDMTVTLPVGWHVNVWFQNKDKIIPHSAVIVPLTERMNESTFVNAFVGSGTQNPMVGVKVGVVQRFSFDTKQAGSYAIVCGEPGHSSGGMWDHLDVSSKVTVPSITLTTQIN